VKKSEIPELRPQIFELIKIKDIKNEEKVDNNFLKK
jgi:hypothetical protein